MNDIQLRNENKFRTPIYGRNFQGTTTCIGALYPEGNVQVYWTWKWFDFQKDAVFRQGSRYCGFQFQNIGHLIGMWDTREIITGLPYDFWHLITTHFAEFYKKHQTTFALSEKEREALGITDEEYIHANKTVWGEKWQDSETYSGSEK